MATADEQIRKFQEFIEDHYKAKLLEAASKGQSALTIDFNDLTKFDPGLAQELLNSPEDALKSAELACRQIDLPEEAKIKPRLTNLPESQKVMISEIRSSHIGKLLYVEGLVRKKTDVRPQVVSSKFECPSCGQIMLILQLDQSLKEPSKCSCGRKGKFLLLSKELVDAQGLVLEEIPESLEGGEQPKRINVFLKEDLVSPISEKRTNPGSKVRVFGILNEVPVILRTGGKGTRFELMLEANNAEASEENFYNITISKEEEQQIIALSQDPRVYEKLIASIAPSIYGYERIKEALVLQLLGGVPKKRKDGITTRGDIHILLVGDPGSGKSQLLKRVSTIAPKGRYVSGKGVSGAGITAAVVRDELLGGWSLEAGALVLANNGVCCTTGDSEFLTEAYRAIKFEDLFKGEKNNIIYPKFKVLALNIKNNRIELFKIKKAFRIKNGKKVFLVKTRTGRELKLTEDNEVLTAVNSEFKWTNVGGLRKGDFLAVPKNYPLDGSDAFEEKFGYLCGLIATDGNISMDDRRSKTSIYNTNKQLIDAASQILTELGETHSLHVQKSGRKSIIRGKEVITKRDLYRLYVSRKDFAQKVIGFGVPAGNKSSKEQLHKKLLTYSGKTLSSFIAGAFDGDGSFRQNPNEATITTGIKENARLFQQIFLRLGIFSSVETSANSWHCTIRGHNQVELFVKKIPFRHPEKISKASSISSKEVKSRIDILPNHNEFFKKLISSKSAKLGKPLFRYFWNYSKPGVSPPVAKLRKLNSILHSDELETKISGDILWDKIVSMEEVKEEWVYDFTMDGTNNFVANDIIMHNCIDELDKMGDDDRDALHESMEQQTLSISKANIQATLLTRTTVLSAANPKHGRFDPYGILSEQLDLPPTLINRFDLIFPVKDVPEPAKDEKMAKHILALHQARYQQRCSRNTLHTQGRE
ncbi:hypothetical protein HYU15_00625 [Candidatus Woesearchaeota archaeon]|nr:hypothetical protein [Candidatus Woesearchaeota archaeon]